jgi:hypothetical protein
MTSPFDIKDLLKWFFKLEYYVYMLVALQLNWTSQEFIFDLCLVFINSCFPHLFIFQEDYNPFTRCFTIFKACKLNLYVGTNSNAFQNVYLSLIWFDNLLLSYIFSSLLKSYNSFHVVCFWKSKLLIF